MSRDFEAYVDDAIIAAVNVYNYNAKKAAAEAAAAGAAAPAGGGPTSDAAAAAASGDATVVSAGNASVPATEAAGDPAPTLV